MGCCGVLVRGIKRIISPPGQTPLDLTVMSTVFIANVASAMIITMPFSFLPRMMRSFGIVEEQIGSYVGIVASSLYIGRATGSFVWGWLCDNIGRKTSLVISEVLILICTVLFGLSGSLYWALATRFLQGAFGGLIIALKATVFVLCDETNSSLGMAVVLSSFQIGLMIGPAIGGYLVFPAESYPETFSKDSLFAKYPFLLPILINSIILAIGTVMTIFIIPETLKKNGEKTKLLNDGDMKEAQLPSENSHSGFKARDYMDIYAYDVLFSKESYTVLSVKSDNKMRNEDDCFDEHGVTVSHFQIADDSHNLLSLKRSVSVPSSKCCKSFKDTSVWKLLKIRSVQLALWLYFIFSFITIGFDETFPIFADSSKSYGGLAFSSGEIGTSVLLAATPMIVLVFWIARLTNRFGDKAVFISTLFVMMFGLPLFPYTAMVPDSYVWYVLIPFLLLQRSAMSTGFLTVNVLLNNSADAEYMGLVNGLGMTVSSVSRAISPSILGSLYSWSLRNDKNIGYPFNHFFPFVLIGFFSLLTLFTAIFIPNKKPVSSLSIDSNSVNEEQASSESTNEDITNV